MSVPDVSVIIPAYNAANTLRETLDSLDRQDSRDFEVILVDDGSSDGTAEMARELLPGGRVVSQPNGGPAAARNAGAAHAKGEWLAFLDADDVWLPWRLSTQLALAAEHPKVALWCGRTAGMQEEVPKPRSRQWTELGLADFAVLNPVSTTTVLLRNAAFHAAGEFDERFRGPEDYDLWIRVAAAATIGKIEIPLSRYREEPGSLSLDDRRFLPEVLGVLDKAYGPGGALRGYASKRRARATQEVHASWMAYRRRARGTALALLARSVLEWPRPLPKSRLKYAFRYIFGRVPAPV